MDERRQAAAAAAEVRQNHWRSGGGSNSEKTKKLNQRRRKDQLLGKIQAIYQSRGTNPPFGLGASSFEALQKHLKVLNMSTATTKACRDNKAVVEPATAEVKDYSGGVPEQKDFIDRELAMDLALADDEAFALVNEDKESTDRELAIALDEQLRKEEKARYWAKEEFAFIGYLTDAKFSNPRKTAKEVIDKLATAYAKYSSGLLTIKIGHRRVVIEHQGTGDIVCYIEELTAAQKRKQHVWSYKCR